MNGEGVSYLLNGKRKGHVCDECGKGFSSTHQVNDAIVFVMNGQLIATINNK